MSESSNVTNYLYESFGYWFLAGVWYELSKNSSKSCHPKVFVGHNIRIVIVIKDVLKSSTAFIVRHRGVAVSPHEAEGEAYLTLGSTLSQGCHPSFTTHLIKPCTTSNELKKETKFKVFD